jgi:hypothetical protein
MAGEKDLIAKQVVEKILSDLTGRLPFQAVWRDMPDEIRQDLRATWEQYVVDALPERVER